MALKVNEISDSSLGLSFICVSDFIFNEGKVVADLEQEKLEKQYENVKRLHLSIYSVISIAEVGREHGGLKFKQDKSNLVVLPNRNSTPPKD